MRRIKSLGMLLLGIWLVLTGLVPFLPTLSGAGTILSILAIAAGILILMGR